MLTIEWASLSLLSAIIWLCLFALNDGSIISLLVIPLVAVAILLLLMIVYDLNNLTWQERRWIWLPITELFAELDLVPYFVDELFLDNRLKEEEFRHLPAYRLGTFPRPYPDNRGKVIRLIKTKP